MSETNKQIYYDGAVGIGTKNPAQSLDVQGKVKVGDDSTPPSAGTIRFTKSGFEGFDGQSWESFTTAGTLAPQAKLDIHNGDIRFQKNHVSNNKKSWEQDILFADEVNRVGAKISGKREQWNGAPMGLAFHTGAINNVTEQMTITSSGNVGIGNTNPAARLQIKASGGDGVNSEFITLLNDGGGATQQSAITWKNGSERKPAAAIASQPGGAYNYGDLRFQTAKNGTLHNRMLINADGNVGIGTTNPAYALDVNGTINAKAVLVDGKLLSTGGGTGNSSKIHLLNANQDANGDTLILGPTDQANLRLGYDTKYAWIQSHGGTSLAINPIGNNVGIGDTAPNQKLTVKGGGIGFDHNSADKKLYSPADGVLEWMTHEVAGERAFAVSHQGDKRVYLNVKGNSYFTGGNVGIGTTDPHGNFKMQIKGGAGPWKGGIASGGTNAAVAIGELDGVATIGGHSAGLDAWNTLLINPVGNVGIGTSTPSEKLEVNGNIKCTQVTEISDLHFKENIQQIPNALKKVTQLRGVNYQWKDSLHGTGTQVGLIAQEVEDIFPETVATDDKGHKSIAYSKMIAPLVEAIKDLKAEKDHDMAILMAVLAEKDEAIAALKRKVEG